MKKILISLLTSFLSILCFSQDYKTIYNPFIDNFDYINNINIEEILQAVNDSATSLFITNSDLIDSLETTNFDQETYGYYNGNMSYFPIDSGVFYIDSSWFVINDGITMIKGLLSGGGGGSYIVEYDTLFFGSKTSGEYIYHNGDNIRVVGGNNEVIEFNYVYSGLTNSAASNRPLWLTSGASSLAVAVGRVRKGYNTGLGGDYSVPALIDNGTTSLIADADSCWIPGYFICDSSKSLKSGVFADYAFEDDYYLPSFFEEIGWIKDNKHLRSLQKEDGSEYITNAQLQRRLEGTVEEVEKLYLYEEESKYMISSLEHDIFRMKIIIGILILIGLIIFIWRKKH